MVVLQAESEVASINMIYGGAAAGKRVLTSSSSPGIALMQEGITYMAGAELPGVFVNVQRGGPGLASLHRVTISRLPVVVVMVTITSSSLPLTPYRRWLTSSTSPLSWRLSIAIRQ